MYPQLTRELNGFLSEHFICGAGVFRDWIIYKSGIEPGKGNKCRFFYDPYLKYFNQDGLDFKTEGLEEEDNSKLVAFLKPTNQPSKNTIPIVNSYLFEHLLPQFKADFADFVLTKPEQLKKYQKKSRDHLDYYFLEESISSSKLIKKKLEGLRDDNYPEQTEFLKKQLSAFERACSAYQSTFIKESDLRNAYGNILEIQNQLEEWTKSNINILEKLQIEAEMLELNKLLKTFVHVCRFDAYLKVNRLMMNEIDAFFSQFAITIRDCDIFEHILLKMADIHDLSPICQFNLDHGEHSRIWIDFSYHEDRDEIAAQVLLFIQSQGDDTAYIEYKEKLVFNDEFDDQGTNLGYQIYEDAIEIECPHPCIVPATTPTTYRFNLDGEIVADVLFPKLKIFVEQLATTNQDFFKPYQKRSQNHFEKKAKDKTKSEIRETCPTFFQQPKESKEEVKSLTHSGPG